MHTSELVLDSVERLKAIANEDRSRILRVLGDGPASSKELAELTGMSHGKVGHHVRVLREAGFIEVAEERPVRAVVERFYALTYQRLRYDYGGASRLHFTLGQAAREAAPEQPFDPPGVLLTSRIPADRAEEFHQRLLDLAEQFASVEEEPGAQVFGFAGSVFLTDTPGRSDQ